MHTWVSPPDLHRLWVVAGGADRRKGGGGMEGGERGWMDWGGGVKVTRQKSRLTADP